MLKDTVRKGSSSSDFQQGPDGILRFYDNSRSMWLSVARQNYYFGIHRKKITGIRWMEMNGRVLSNLSGYLMPRNGVITSISITTNDFTNSEFYIQQNKTTNLYMALFNGEKNKVFDNLTININKQDILSCYVKVVSGYLYYPEMTLEIAWR